MRTMSRFERKLKKFFRTRVREFLKSAGEDFILQQTRGRKWYSLEDGWIRIDMDYVNPDWGAEVFLFRPRGKSFDVEFFSSTSKDPGVYSVQELLDGVDGIL